MLTKEQVLNLVVDFATKNKINLDFADSEVVFPHDQPNTELKSLMLKGNNAIVHVASANKPDDNDEYKDLHIASYTFFVDYNSGQVLMPRQRA